MKCRSGWKQQEHKNSRSELVLHHFFRTCEFFTCCIIEAMTRRAVISRIRRHRAQLEKLGVKSLSIFGSFARGEERPDSDVDILVEFEGRATFDRYMDTKFYLEELLGRKVDLVTPKAIKPRMKPYIMQDLIHVA
jgi:uncharacterized protein